MKTCERQKVEIYKCDIEKLKLLKHKYGFKSLNETTSWCIDIVNDFIINNIDPIDARYNLQKLSTNK